MIAMKKAPSKKIEFSTSCKLRLKELRDLESKIYIEWGGRDRLTSLVTKTLLVKFEKAEALFKNSLVLRDSQEIIKMVEMMFRAYAALISDCKDFGFKEIDPHVRCFDWDGQIWYVTDMDYQVPRAMNKHKAEGNVNFISIQELMRTIPKDLMEMRMEIAMMFQGSKFIEVKK